MKEFYLKFMGTACMTLAMAGAMHAEVLQPADALSRALSQATAPAKAPSRSAAANMQLTGTFNANDGLPAAYLFTSAETDATGNPSAFALVAADDIVSSMLLGYSDSAPAINGLNSIPPALHRLILDYASEIETMRANGIKATPAQSRAEVDTREPVQPLVTTHWNQNAPFNLQCPVVDETFQCVTGCVATAMAQVMNYHKWPKTAHGSNSYTLDIYNPYTGIITPEITLSMDFNGLTFDWDNMLDDYTYTKLPEGGYEANFSQAQSDAVSTLMKACGFATNLDYSPYETYGYDINVLHALLTYFDYDRSAHIIRRQYTPIADWEQQIYDNLTDYGPVYMSGQSTGGHAFVIDGYSSDRFFHVNWGWGGVSDGYFRLTAMDPSQQGIGAATTTGYNYYQWAMLGIRPNTGSQTYPPATLCMPAGLRTYNTEISDGKLVINSSIENHEHYPVSGLMALRLTGYTADYSEMIPGESFDFPANYSQYGLQFQLPAINGDGIYFAYLYNSDRSHDIDNYRLVSTHVATKPYIALQNENGQWSILRDFGLSNVTADIVDELTDKTHFVGFPSNVGLKVTNGDTNGNELHGDAMLYIVDKENNYIATLSWQNMAMTPGESNDYKFYGFFINDEGSYVPAGEYTLCAQVSDANMIYDLCPITILDPDAVETEISVEHVGLTEPSAPVDLSELRVEATVSCSKGARSFNELALGFYVDSKFIGRNRGYRTYLKGGQSALVTAYVDVSHQVPEGSTLRVCPIEVIGNNEFLPLDPAKYWEYTNTQSGIESTIGDEARTITVSYNATDATLSVTSMACISSVEIFNTSGTRVLYENVASDQLLSTSVSLDTMPRGAYIVKATANDGQTATCKLLR